MTLEDCSSVRTIISNGTSAPRPRRRTSAARTEQRILVTRVGLNIPTGLSFDGWERAGRRLFNVADSSTWCIGDWVVYGQTRYVDRYRRAVEAAGLDYQTIRNYAWVARRFDLSRRRYGLSFQHHAEVAALEPHEQDFWLTNAERFGWSRNELRRQLRSMREDGAGSASLTALPRITVELERLERWRIAAERAETSLTSWIVAQLEQAASSVLKVDTHSGV